jgi:hypothetical protein
MARRRRKGILKRIFGRASGGRRKSRRGGKMAARMRNKPAHCKKALGDCMRARRGPGKCMKQYHACG